MGEITRNLNHLARKKPLRAAAETLFEGVFEMSRLKTATHLFLFDASTKLLSRMNAGKRLIAVIRLWMSHVGFLPCTFFGCVKAVGKHRTLPKCQTTFNMAGYGVEGGKLRLQIFERGKNKTTADNAPGSVSFDGQTGGLIN